ncbi:Kelch repeat-containing protein, partial [Lachnellula suecica]
MTAKILGCVLLFARVSLQQKDPLANFCRRFGHQTCVIDSKLYVDGGQVNWNPIAANPTNQTNTWESFHDLTTSPAGIGAPQLHANLSKNSTIPDVSGGILWPDEVNKRFYLFGGDNFLTSPSAPNLLSYDAFYDKWDSYGTPSQGIQSPAWGAGVGISDVGEGYLLGGWLSNTSVSGWTGAPFATNSMLKYDMDQQTWTNMTGPLDNQPRVEGVMVYIPASDSGMLVTFGGMTVDSNGTTQAAPMETIQLYDIKSNNWYTQTASGIVPPTRRRFCAGAAWAPDHSSYNIYIYGGLGFGANGPGFDDVWILSLPSFKWIPYYQSVAGSGHPHHSLTCNVVGGQMLIIGGTFPMTDECDSVNTWGVHNLDMGKVSGHQWNIYQTNITTYVVPPDVISVVGGSSLGGATASAPVNGFQNGDLGVYFTQKASIAARTATRALPAATQSSTTKPSATPAAIKITGAAVAGIAVGGAIFVSSLVLGACFLIRQKRRKPLPPTPPPLIIPKSAAPDYSQTPFSPQSQYSHVGTFRPAPHFQLPTTPEPVELYGSNYRHHKSESKVELYHSSHDMRESQHPSYNFPKSPPPRPRHAPGSPSSTYSDSGTHFSGSNTLYGSPPTP